MGNNTSFKVKPKTHTKSKVNRKTLIRTFMKINIQIKSLKTTNINQMIKQYLSRIQRTSRFYI